MNLFKYSAHLSFYAAYIMSLDTVQFSGCIALTLTCWRSEPGFNNSHFTCGIGTPIEADRKVEKSHTKWVCPSIQCNAPVFQRIWPTFIRLDLSFHFWIIHEQSILTPSTTKVIVTGLSSRASDPMFTPLWIATWLEIISETGLVVELNETINKFPRYLGGQNYVVVCVHC